MCWKGMPLVSLNLSGTAVVNLAPLIGAPLVRLDVSNTRVRDLQPLARMSALRTLRLENTPITDLTPLIGLPIAQLQITRCGGLRNVALLVGLRSLKSIGLPHQAQGVAALKGLPELSWIAYGMTLPDIDTDGSRARQFWEDFELEEKVRTAEPSRRLQPSLFPAITRRFPGIVQNEGHWYLYVDTPCTWTEAREMAALMGGHLATITSKEEDDFLLRSFGNRIPAGREIFLGAQADHSQGTWKWITGEPWSYTRWARRGGRETEPNGQSSGAGEPDAPVLFLALRNESGYANNPAWEDLADRSSEVVGFLVEWED